MADGNRVEYRFASGYDGKYLVGDDGSVWRRLRGKKNKDGYLKLILYRLKRRWHVMIHRLVLMTFVGEAPEGMVACHKDGDRTNNCLSNLRWDTQKSNSEDKVLHGTDQRGERHPNARLTADKVRDIRRLLQDGELTQGQIGELFGVSNVTVSAIGRSRIWGHLK